MPKCTATFRTHVTTCIIRERDNNAVQLKILLLQVYNKRHFRVPTGSIRLSRDVGNQLPTNRVGPKKNEDLKPIINFCRVDQNLIHS